MSGTLCVCLVIILCFPHVEFPSYNVEYTAPKNESNTFTTHQISAGKNIMLDMFLDVDWVKNERTTHHLIEMNVINLKTVEF